VLRCSSYIDNLPSTMTARPYLALAATQHERDFQHALHRTLADLRRFDDLFDQLPYLNQLLQECFTPFDRLHGDHSSSFATATFAVVELAISHVAASFQRMLSRESTMLDDISADELLESPPKQEPSRIRRCRTVHIPRYQDVDSKVSSKDRAKVIDQMVGALKYESMLLESRTKDSTPDQQEWMFRFALFMLMQIARVLSKQFLGREISILDQIVPGTARLVAGAPGTVYAVNVHGSVESTAEVAQPYLECVHEAEALVAASEFARNRERAEKEDEKALRLSQYAFDGD